MEINGNEVLNIGFSVIFSETSYSKLQIIVMRTEGNRLHHFSILYSRETLIQELRWIKSQRQGVSEDYALLVLLNRNVVNFVMKFLVRCCSKLL